MRVLVAVLATAVLGEDYHDEVARVQTRRRRHQEAQDFCLDGGRRLLAAYERDHWSAGAAGDEEIGWPPLLLAGIEHCGAAAVAREATRGGGGAEGCHRETMEWIEMNVAAMYHNMAVSAFYALELEHENRHAGATDVPPLAAEREEIDEVAQYVASADAFFDVAGTCDERNRDVIAANRERHEALRPRVANLAVEIRDELAAERTRLTTPEGHAEIQGECPWQIYAIAEAAEEKLYPDVRSHVPLRTLEDNLESLFPHHKHRKRGAT